MKSEPVKLGLVGCGGYGRTLARACVQSAKIELAACYDVNFHAAEAFAAEFGCQARESEDALLQDGEIRGIIISTPNNAHRPSAVAAAESGKHVFVDKPIANTIADGLEMVQACKRRGVVLAVGHNQRRSAGHRKMKELIESGAIGTPITAEANFSHAAGLSLQTEHWRASRERCPALPLMQLGVHHADTLRYLLGDIVEVSSFMDRLATPVENDDATVTILRFASGTLGYLGSNYATPYVYYINIFGTGGNLFCEGSNGLVYRKAGDSQPSAIEVEPVPTQIEELEEFADCIQTGAKPEVGGEEALKALAVVRAALMSAQERRPVAIAEVMGVGG